MSPPPRNHTGHPDPAQQPQNSPSSPRNQQHQHQQQQMMPFMPQSSLPSTPIPLYPTGAAAIIPAPPTYEVIPNRIFVGGFPTSRIDLQTTESDLREHFEKFFPVKDVKMVKSLDGVSKGYGFITFETEDQAEEIRKLNPKQLEFRNRKLNLGPAIRKICGSAFPPGYAIATPSQLVSASPSFGYAIPASPSPYGGYSISATPQMFVYPPVVNQNRSPNEQQTSPQLSPSQQQQQQQQIFFAPGEQEPARTYATAVSGSEKGGEAGLEELQMQPNPQGPQPLGVNNNSMNMNAQQYQPWNGHGYEMDANNNYQQTYYGENYGGGYAQPAQPYSPYTPNGMSDKNGAMPMPMHFYMNSNGMYQPSYTYMSPPLPGGQYPQLIQSPYWSQNYQQAQNQPHHQQHNQYQHQQTKNQYSNGYNAGYNNNNNNYVGPAGDIPNGYHYQGYHHNHHGGHDENSFSRPLQAPRAGKKNRKASESHEKKNKSPTKGISHDKTANSSTASPDQKSSKKSIPPIGAFSEFSPSFLSIFPIFYSTLNRSISV
uniref:RRM domain-containing protein n=1 Tax=Caenorhabditis japonica TaxID=281687 RepID=A0A8R1DV03_CAEJA